MASAALLHQPLTGLTDRRNDVSTVTPETNSAGFFAPASSVPASIMLRVQAQAGRLVREFRISIESSSVPHWLEISLKQVGNLMLLPGNWDFQGAPPVHLTAVQAAMDTLTQFMDPNATSPQWTPTPSGGVQLDWHQNAIDLEITVENGSDSYAVFSDHGDSNAEWDGPVNDNLGRLRQIVDTRLNVHGS